MSDTNKELFEKGKIVEMYDLANFLAKKGAEHWIERRDEIANALRDISDEIKLNANQLRDEHHSKYNIGQTAENRDDYYGTHFLDVDKDSLDVSDHKPERF